MIVQMDEDCGVKKIKEFYNELDEAVKNESEVILDFTKVRRIDLSVAQVIIAADRKLKQNNGSLILKSVNDQVQEQLALVDF